MQTIIANIIIILYVIFFNIILLYPNIELYNSMLPYVVMILFVLFIYRLEINKTQIIFSVTYTSIMMIIHNLFYNIGYFNMVDIYTISHVIFGTILTIVTILDI